MPFSATFVDFLSALRAQNLLIFHSSPFSMLPAKAYRVSGISPSPWGLTHVEALEQANHILIRSSLSPSTSSGRGLAPRSTQDHGPCRSRQDRTIVYTTSLGIAADRWDAKAFDPATVQLLKDAGVTSLRFPGNNGIAELYHWSTGAITNPYTNDRAPAFAPERKFPVVASVIDDLGTAMVSVNYGSNLDGSGGGEPAEAAAWVAYANGKTSSKQVIGKDSKGNDWKTVGYWASLRASTPLPTDDGFNALRIQHLDPLGIQLWTVGDAPYYNGFYGQDHTPGSDADTTGLYGQAGSPEPDLHAGQVPTSRDWGRHAQNQKVGPQVYGAAVVEFVKAMKAVDPTIFVGAALTMPLTVSASTDPNPMGKNWNAAVLKGRLRQHGFQRRWSLGGQRRSARLQH